MSWILTFLVFVILAQHQADSSGVFELRLISFDNEAGKDDKGRCCSGISAPNSECEGMCRPRFRICLKEYQVKIDTTSPCTFGDVITTEFETNPGSDNSQNGFENSIALPFPFTWPGTFSLIVEAWHGNQTSHPAVLVSRLTRQRWLDVSDKWTEDVHSSNYSTLKFEYRVTCKSHYYGKGCENLCRPRDDQFGHYSCSPTGERVCLAGWTGDYCTKPQCLPGCDEQHGHCTKPNECRCQSGWEGPLCDQCQRYPGCMHGTCVKPWDCLCNEGWGGLFCNQDLNFCTNHKPCRNGGTCFNTGQGSYTCSCPAGYTGTNCELPLHDCAKTPCLNGGTCNRNSTLNICICPSGYSGPRCETSIRNCDEKPCQNGGSCTNTDSGYRCECRPGYSGPDCEYQANSCNPNPCKNDGTCVESTNGFTCICPSGFTGERCETNIDDCLGNPCQNGGTCVDKINEFRCQCVPGYVGPLCQNRVDYCITKPCANGGTCLQLINDYECKCAPGFTGKDCSEEVDECQVEPCQHGGTCVNRVHGFECYCPPGFLGRQCEEVSSSAAPSARVSSESNLTTEHVVVIATISTFVPLVVLIAVGVIVCLKQRRKREKARADEEARLQNEQNTANSSFAKRGAAMAADAHMIKNSWGKCTNNVMSSNISSPDDCSVSNISVSECDGFPKSTMHQVIDGRPVYSLQRTRSQKQLNTEPGPRASALLAAKLHEPEYEHIKRLSVMSNASAVCGSSDPSLLKRPVEKESNGVYVIEEHFLRPDAISAGLFATEV
ncbi:neurogenic locus protein delta [Tribolium madens]|uniref:neurogenic locus protein delta n=1 Tax=Tribolium madens TaxID=41895 RepID=UPI001CF744F7|nr:neurogenic locus protein delta [Tribolium madens]XP_044257278.1 neurogenic locus protein delta [Tribolium madens]XP_044257279.1 neurogenic locus protein delta [Tribolium madens]